VLKLDPAPNGYLCRDDPGEPGRLEQRWSVNDGEARLLSELLYGRNVLEIGTGLGVSTRKIAETALTVHTVDIDLWVKENVAPTLPGNVTFYDDILRVPTGLDAAFIDGSHKADQCSRDIEDAIRIVGHGMIVFHDANQEGVTRAIQKSRLTFCAYVRTEAGMGIGWY